MKIELSKLHIRNFKGIESFKLNLNGKSATVAGQNGTGKTSVADAFYWLFDDKDSAGESRFNVLRLDRDGNPVARIDATVEAEIKVGPRTIKLNKKFKQVWSKKRGSITYELKRHTTEHEIDGLPLKKNEYAEKLSEILPLDKIRMLSDVHHFCGRMSTDERRKVLFELVDPSGGRIPDDFDNLFKEMGTLSTEDYRKKLNAEKRQIEKDLNAIPGQIEGKQEMIADLKKGNEVKLREELKTIEDQISAKKTEILAIRSGLQITELKSKLAEIKGEMAAVSTSFISEIDHEIMTFNRHFASINNDIARSQNVIKNLLDKKSSLADEWRQIDARKYDKSENCFACGQRLPNEKIIEQIDMFKSEKSAELMALDDIAMQIISDIKKEENSIAEMTKQSDSIKEKINALEARRSKSIREVEEKRDKIRLRQSDIENKIIELSKDIEPEINAIEYTLVDLEKQRNEINSNILDIIQADKCELSIKRKKEALIELAQRHEGIEKRLNELIEVERQRSHHIEKNVTDKFKITSWKLFEVHQNGNQREICEPMRDGVPYSSDLNTGSRINVGIDCIKTLSNHYDVLCPIFVDNAEAVTTWEHENGQIIKLVAMANVSKLEII